jgi:hypothetical protein
VLEFLPIVLIAAAVALAAWLASQGRYEFLVKIENGLPRTARGKVAAVFLQTIGEACQRNGVRRGWIGGVRTGKRIALVFSSAIPKSCQQQIRNEWVMSY